MNAQQDLVHFPALRRRGMYDLIRQTLKWRFKNILDIGTGDGSAAHYFLAQGKKVTAIGYDLNGYSAKPLSPKINVYPNTDICDMSGFADASFDAVWCSHVVEHVQNVGLALKEIRRVLKPNGMLFLIVPEYFPILVGGHVSTGWTVGTLMYNLILSSFNVREGEFINHCWNIAGFVRRGDYPSEKLRHDIGDLEVLADHFPSEFCVAQGMNSNVLRVNWRWRAEIRKSAEMESQRAATHRRIVELVPPVLMRGWRKLRRP